jgi:hypothetical protein
VPCRAVFSAAVPQTWALVQALERVRDTNCYCCRAMSSTSGPANSSAGAGRLSTAILTGGCCHAGPCLPQQDGQKLERWYKPCWLGPVVPCSSVSWLTLSPGVCCHAGPRLPQQDGAARALVQAALVGPRVPAHGPGQPGRHPRLAGGIGGQAPHVGRAPRSAALRRPRLLAGCLHCCQVRIALSLVPLQHAGLPHAAWRGGGSSPRGSIHMPLCVSPILHCC